MASTVYRGSASSWYYKAETYLNKWTALGKIANNQEYLNALNAINTANNLDSSHPDYLHLLGRVMYWGVTQGFEPKEKLPLIKQLYIKSTSLRPLWPQPWIDLAHLNNLIDGFNHDTKNYIEQALHAGPYLDEVNVQVIKILIEHWAVLEEHDRELMFKQFRITTWRPKILNQILIDAKLLGQHDLLCDYLSVNPNYNKKYKETDLYQEFCTSA